MILFRRILPLCIALLHGLGLEFIFRYPDHWWWVWIFTGIVLLLSVVLINDWNVIGMMFVDSLFRRSFWSGAYAIAMFLISIFQHLIAALSAGALWWFFENLFTIGIVHPNIFRTRWKIFLAI